MSQGLNSIVPVTLSMVGLVLALSFIFRIPLTSLVERVRQRKRFARGTQLSDSLNVPLPPVNTIHIFVAGSLGGILSTFIAAWIFTTIWWIIGLPFLCAGSCLLAIWAIEQRLQHQTSQQLIAAAAEISAAMNSGMTLNAALKQIGEQLSEPLATPWCWMTNLAGSSIIAEDGSQRFLQMKDTVNIVASQSTNRVLLRFLEHVEAAADLPQGAARDRMLAVSDALYTSQLREKSTRAKLAHARGSGIIVMSVGLGIALFLRFAMAEQWRIAFSGPFGVPASLFFGLLFSLPLIGIVVLTRVPSIDF